MSATATKRKTSAVSWAVHYPHPHLHPHPHLTLTLTLTVAGWSCLFGWALSLIGVIIIFFVSRKQLQLAIMGFIIEIIMVLIALQIAFNYIHA